MSEGLRWSRSGRMAVGAMAGMEATTAAAAVDGAVVLGRGVIIGAMLVGAAFLAGVAVLRQSAAAFCGVILLTVAFALQTVWLGVIPTPSAAVGFLLPGLFAAAALVFLSATIGIASRNQLLGGVLFAAALSMAGIAIFNTVLGGDASNLQRLGLTIAAAMSISLAAFAGARGDSSARLILPGALLIAAAPLLGAGGNGVLSLAPQAVFAIGVLIASLVAVGDVRSARSAAPAPSFAEPAPRYLDPPPLEPLGLSENKLAEVLDYSGIAVWDWNRRGGRQSHSFSAKMGADSDGAFTPAAFREFVHASDRERLDAKVYGAGHGDGNFDETVKLQDGRRVRLRGARAVDSTNDLERIVVFLEEIAAPPPVKNDALKLAAASLAASAAAIKPAAADRDGIGAAIDRGDIVAVFQPIVSFDTGKVRGAEALTRWAGDAGGKAEDIVKRAQAAGRGADLAAIMMRAAARYAAQRIAGGDKQHFAAFNVSVSQLRDKGFVENVRNTIADYKLPSGALVLELTEGDRLAETPKILETFKALRAAGAALAYDDFGAGYSSLANLHRYHFDYLKIDKSFIDDIVANGGKKKIVAALAKLGRDFDMTVIAEGVESEEAAEMAKAIGCRMGQGYHLGAPAAEGDSRGSETKPAIAELATVEIRKDAGELVLDRSLAAPKASLTYKPALLSEAPI